jgi:Cytochrome C oxidase, cbb3-type, subunit III
VNLRILWSGMLLLIFLASGCRGLTSKEPPVHVNLNMDTQNKYKPYRASDFFTDKRDMRPRVEGTVARGQLQEDDHFYRGMKDGELVKTLPGQLTVDKVFLEKGRAKFNIYCASCHSRVGDGNGMVGRRLPIRPTTFYSEYLYNQPLGHFYNVISEGIRTMPSYKFQISEEEDRWAIVAYVRALQFSQNPDLKSLIEGVASSADSRKNIR